MKHILDDRIDLKTCLQNAYINEFERQCNIQFLESLITKDRGILELGRLAFEGGPIFIFKLLPDNCFTINKG